MNLLDQGLTFKYNGTLYANLDTNGVMHVTNYLGDQGVWMVSPSFGGRARVFRSSIHFQTLIGNVLHKFASGCYKDAA
jgi:hypothetical protein